MSYYDDLEVSPNASAEEIKRAYRRLAIQYHPDKGGSNDDFLRIQTAYDTLSDSEKRAQYDSQSSNPFNNFFASFNFHTMFSAINKVLRPRLKLATKREKFTLTIQQALEGTDCTIQKTLTRLCERCCKVCDQCSGSGLHMKKVSHGFAQTICDKCTTLGYVFSPVNDDKPKCTCNYGRVIKTFDLNFYVPPHAAKEANITFPEMGEQAERYVDLHGDLIIEIEIDTGQDNLTYDKKTGNVLFKPKVNVTDLMIGTTVDIPACLHPDVPTKHFVIIPPFTLDPTWIATIPKLGLVNNEQKDRGNLVIQPAIDYTIHNKDRINLDLLKQALNPPD